MLINNRTCLYIIEHVYKQYNMIAVKFVGEVYILIGATLVELKKVTDFHFSFYDYTACQYKINTYNMS